MDKLLSLTQSRWKENDDKPEHDYIILLFQVVMDSSLLRGGSQPNLIEWFLLLVFVSCVVHEDLVYIVECLFKKII